MVSAVDVFIKFHLLDILIIALLMYAWGRLNKVNPQRLYIPRKDSRCSYPKIKGGITEQQNLVITITIPVIIYTVLYILLKCNVKIYFKPFDFLFVVIAHTTCICVSNIIISIIKAQVGRARPDFYDTLGSNASAEMEQPKNVSSKEFVEEFKSFASGHSTTASSGTIFLVLFLNLGINVNQIWPTVLIDILLLYLFFIGGTRIRHHRHHTEDVIMGVFIGAIFPILFFIGYEESLFCDSVIP